MATNVQKKKTQIKRKLPQGPSRYDPCSPEWEQILIEQSEKAKSKVLPNRKKNVAKAKKGSKGTKKK